MAEKIPYLGEKETADGILYKFKCPRPMRRAGFRGENLGYDRKAAVARIREIVAEFEALQAAENEDAQIRHSVGRVIDEFTKDVLFYKSMSAARQAELDLSFAEIRKEFGHHPIAAIKRRHVRAYYNQLHDERSHHKAWKTIKDLRRLFKFAIEMEIVEANPCAELGIETPKGRAQLWTPKEIGQIIRLALDGWDFKTKRNETRNVIPRPSIALAVAISYETSMPEQDLLSLTWDQWDGSAFVITQKKRRSGRELYQKTGPITRQVMTEAEIEPKAGEAVILCETTGAAYQDKNAFGRIFRRFREKAGVSSELQFRDIRRTMLTNLGESGATEAEISAFSGHAPGSRILATYVKPGRDAAKRAARKRDRAKFRVIDGNK